MTMHHVDVYQAEAGWLMRPWDADGSMLSTLPVAYASQEECIAAAEQAYPSTPVSVIEVDIPPAEEGEIVMEDENLPYTDW